MCGSRRRSDCGKGCDQTLSEACECRQRKDAGQPQRRNGIDADRECTTAPAEIKRQPCRRWLMAIATDADVAQHGCYEVAQRSSHRGEYAAPAPSLLPAAPRRALSQQGGRCVRCDDPKLMPSSAGGRRSALQPHGAALGQALRHIHHAMIDFQGAKAFRLAISRLS